MGRIMCKVIDITGRFRVGNLMMTAYSVSLNAYSADSESGGHHREAAAAGATAGGATVIIIRSPGSGRCPRSGTAVAKSPASPALPVTGHGLASSH